MKIFYIYTALVTKGGADRVIIEKANWLAEHGYDVAIITDTQLGRQPVFPLCSKVRLIDLAIDFSKEYGHNILVRFFLYLKLMRTYRRDVERILYKEHPDIVVTTLGRDISFISKVKDGSLKIGEAHTTKHFIRNFHLLENKNIFFKYLTKYFRWSMDRQVARLDALVVLTQEHRDNWEGIVPTYVISNSLPFYPEETSSCDNKQAIIVGRYNSAKGYSYLVDAWKIVNEKHPDWVINIYGSGEEKDHVRKMIDDNELQDVMIMNDPTDDIQHKYIESSIYVMSSVYEGFGMVLLEAMACGLPCVSFDCPFGPRNIINDGEDGFLVEYLNSCALAERICQLIENVEMRKRLGQNGRINIQRFSRENVMGQWDKLFKSISKE